jgi:hypothetical protein
MLHFSEVDLAQITALVPMRTPTLDHQAQRRRELDDDSYNEPTMTDGLHVSETLKGLHV